MDNRLPIEICWLTILGNNRSVGGSWQVVLKMISYAMDQHWKTLGKGLARAQDGHTSQEVHRIFLPKYTFSGHLPTKRGSVFAPFDPTASKKPRNVAQICSMGVKLRVRFYSVLPVRMLLRKSHSTGGGSTRCANWVNGARKMRAFFNFPYV